jgi:hypothetical protein
VRLYIIEKKLEHDLAGDLADMVATAYHDRRPIHTNRVNHHNPSMLIRISIRIAGPRGVSMIKGAVHFLTPK